MPWGHWLDPHNHLTGAQRYFYLVGGMQWFTDVLNLIFGFFLSLGAVASIFYGIFSVRPLTGPLLIIPALFLFLHMWRFLWVLRQALHLRLRVALRSMYNFFSLGWAVTLACLQGLIRKRGVFLRTPKSQGTSRTWDALRVTQWEMLIGLIFLGFGMAAFIARPGFKTFWLALLLGWQASLFLAAPYFSLLSVRVLPAPNMRQPSLDRGIAVAENSTARWAWATLMVFVAFIWLAFQIPLPKQPPTYSQFQPPEVPPQLLLGIQPANVTPTATIIPTNTPTALFIPPTLELSTATLLPTTTATLPASPTVVPPTVTAVLPVASPTLLAPTDTPPPAPTAIPPTAQPTLVAPTDTPAP